MATSPTPHLRKGRLAPLEREGSDASSVGLPTASASEVGTGNMLAVPTGPPGIRASPTTNTPKDGKAPPVQRFEEESMVVGNSASDGMHTFGIGKAGISRAVVIFTKPPSPHPYSVCFHFPNTFLSHAYVLHCLYDVLKDVTKSGIVSLSFRDRNVLHGCTGLENRWIVHCKNLTVKDTLVERGLALCNKRVLVRNLDEVVEEEYAEYTRYKSHRTKLYGNVHDQLKRGHKGVGVIHADNSSDAGQQ